MDKLRVYVVSKDGTYILAEDCIVVRLNAAEVNHIDSLSDGDRWRWAKENDSAYVQALDAYYF